MACVSLCLCVFVCFNFQPLAQFTYCMAAHRAKMGIVRHIDPCLYQLQQSGKTLQLVWAAELTLLTGWG